MKNFLLFVFTLLLIGSACTQEAERTIEKNIISHAAHTDTSKVLKWADVLYLAKNGVPEPDSQVVKTEKEWKEILSEEQYRIMRMKGTEAPGSSELCYLFEPGIYACAACGTKLFDASTKYQSNTGWPSFTQPLKANVVKYKVDKSFGMERVEVLCNVCGSHLGHVFPDGPEPSGLRYCINALSLEKTDSVNQ